MKRRPVIEIHASCQWLLNAITLYSEDPSLDVDLSLSEAEQLLQELTNACTEYRRIDEAAKEDCRQENERREHRGVTSGDDK